MKKDKKLFKYLAGIFIVLQLFFFLDVPSARSAHPYEPVVKGHDALQAGKYDEALKWFQKAAKKNLPYGIYRVGYMYEKGFGVDKNPVTALEYYEKAAQMDFDVAVFQMAELYERGDDGVPQNYDKARKLYLKCDGMGGSTAPAFKLGQMYELGRGVEQNKEIAYDWYSKAAAGGNEDAKKAVALLDAEKNAFSPEKVETEKLTTPEHVVADKQSSIRNVSMASGDSLTSKPKTFTKVKGKVIIIKGNDVLIRPEGKVLVARGDMVELSFTVAGDTISVGTWQVSSIEENNSVAAVPVEVKGEPNIGMDAIISTGNAKQ